MTSSCMMSLSIVSLGEERISRRSHQPMSRRLGSTMKIVSMTSVFGPISSILERPCPTVRSSRRAMYSVVMRPPAESPGYCKRFVMIWRSSAFIALISSLRRPIGISPSISTISSFCIVAKPLRIRSLSRVFAMRVCSSSSDCSMTEPSSSSVSIGVSFSISSSESSSTCWAKSMAFSSATNAWSPSASWFSSRVRSFSSSSSLVLSFSSSEFLSSAAMRRSPLFHLYCLK